MLRFVGGALRLVVKISLLAVGIGAIIAYANLSNLDGWKKQVSRQVMSVAGRKLSFNGDVEFKISFPPRIIARDVRLQNVSWGARKDMLRADTVIADVDFLPLLVGDVAVPRLRLVGVDIIVETGRSGKTNWDEFNSFQTAAGGSVFNPGVPVVGPPMGSGGVTVAGGTLTLSNLTTGASTTLTLPDIPVAVASGISQPCN